MLYLQVLEAVAAISSRQWGDDMASAEREPIRGVWGRSPQRGPGAEPLVRGQGVRPPEAESFLVLERPTERQNLSRCQFLAMVRIGCAVRK